MGCSRHLVMSHPCQLEMAPSRIFAEALQVTLHIMSDKELARRRPMPLQSLAL